MMYRRNAAVTPRREASSMVAAAGFMDAVRSAVAAMFGLDIYEAAHRENRRRNRYQKRQWKHSTWHLKNGEREKSRRRRQIASGALTVANGLMA